MPECKEGGYEIRLVDRQGRKLCDEQESWVREEDMNICLGNKDIDEVMDLYRSFVNLFRVSESFAFMDILLLGNGMVMEESKGRTYHPPDCEQVWEAERLDRISYHERMAQAHRDIDADYDYDMFGDDLNGKEM